MMTDDLKCSKTVFEKLKDLKFSYYLIGKKKYAKSDLFLASDYKFFTDFFFC